MLEIFKGPLFLQGQRSEISPLVSITAMLNSTSFAQFLSIKRFKAHAQREIPYFHLEGELVMEDHDTKTAQIHMTSSRSCAW